MVELEIGVLNRQCLGRRIGDKASLRAEIGAWQQPRNEAEAAINWMFSVDDARAKLTKMYAELPSAEIPNAA